MTKAPVRVGMGRLNLLAGRDRSLIAVVAAPKVWEQWTIRSSSVGCGKGGCDNIQYLSSTYNEGEITCDLPMPYIVSKSVGSSSFFPQHASSDLMPRSYFFFWLLIHAIWCCLRGGYEARYVESLYLLSVSFGGGRPATAYLLSVSSEEMTLIRFKCSSWLVCSLGLRKVNVVDGEALGAIVNTGGENLKHKIYNNARKGELFLKRLTVNRIHIWKKGVLYYV